MLYNFAGEVRKLLPWADGKAVKNEVDIQVGIISHSSFGCCIQRPLPDAAFMT